MEAWLLFPFRMIPVILVAVVVYTLCHRVESQLTLSDPSVAASADVVQPREPASVVPLVTGILTFVLVFGLAEAFSLRRFSRTIQAIEDLGGSIRFDPPYENAFLRYIGATATVDLSDTSVDDAMAPAFAAIPGLKTLRLSNTSIGPAAMETLTKCKTLASVDLSHTQVTDTDLAPVSRIRSLRNLILNNTNITDEVARHLGACRSLTQLQFQDTAITADGIQRLSQALPSVALIHTIDSR